MINFNPNSSLSCMAKTFQPPLKNCSPSNLISSWREADCNPQLSPNHAEWISSFHVKHWKFVRNFALISRIGLSLLVGQTHFGLVRRRYFSIIISGAWSGGRFKSKRVIVQFMWRNEVLRTRSRWMIFNMLRQILQRRGGAKIRFLGFALSLGEFSCERWRLRRSQGSKITNTQISPWLEGPPLWPLSPHL